MPDTDPDTTTGKKSNAFYPAVSEIRYTGALSYEEALYMNRPHRDSLPSILESLTVNRRTFLGSLAGGTVLALADLRSLLAADVDARPIVVGARHPDATTWDFQTGWYGDHVSQPLVDTLLDRGLLELTGQTDVIQAWRSLLPGYQTGRKIAVKVNFNNGWACNETHNMVDALVEVVNALARGLTAAGVAPEDIWLYDVVRIMPDRFLNRLRCPGVVCWTKNGSCGTRQATWSGTKPGSVITFSRPIRQQLLPDVVVDADYLINIPITKRHSLAGITLGYKNHFGSIESCWNVHDYIWLTSSVFTTSYNPLVEIMANPHFGPKTVLTIGDCLFGSLKNQSDPPLRWTTFGNQAPGLLLLSRDPVAIDCVQRDLLYREAARSTDALAESYLALAAQAGQGVYEKVTPSGPYQLIDYRHLELAGVGWFRTYGQAKPGTSGRPPCWRFTGVPRPGGTVKLEIIDGVPHSVALVLVGYREADIPHLLGRILVDPVAATFQVPLDASGTARIPLALPSGLGAVGAEYTAQAVVVDAGVSHGISYTGGLKLHIGNPV